MPGLAALLALLLFASVASATSLDGVVVRVVDGDTIQVRVADRVEKVRYIGVNTPEVHHPGKGEEPGGRQAMNVNRTLVERRAVRLETDVQSRDRYGRLLAYVWVGDVMVNAELVRRGYARTLEIPPNTDFADRFDRLERRARAEHRGLWRACGDA